MISTATLTKEILVLVNTNQNCNLSTEWNGDSAFCIPDELCRKIKDLGLLGNSVSYLETVEVKSYHNTIVRGHTAFLMLERV
jgi:hypothetical protein